MPCKTHGPNCDGDCINPNVDNGMMTKVWGPPGWLFLHCITFGYPYAINPNNPDHQHKKRDYAIFFKSLGNVFPCKYCRESYLKFIKELPIEPFLNSRKDLTDWLYQIHNKVNHKLGVPHCDIPSLNDITDIYEQYRAKCKKTTNQERDKNASKGCVTPANGKKKKCIMKVVGCGIDKKDNSYEFVNTHHIFIGTLLVIIIMGIILNIKQ